MGPTWYWMPDVFEKFFTDFDKTPSDYYDLEKLAPAYKVFFDKDDSITISDKLDCIYEVFEKEEKGSSKFLSEFLDSAEFNYRAAIDNLVYKPGNSILELITFETISRANQFFQSISKRIRKILCKFINFFFFIYFF